MAIQAQYPSYVLLLNRNIVQDNKDYTLQPQPGGGGGEFMEQSPMLFNNNGVGGIDLRKSSRDFAATPATTTINSFNFSRQNQNQNQLIDLSQLQLQNHHQHQQQQTKNGVSTGLGLSFADQNYQIQQQTQQQPNTFSSLRFEDFALQFKQQTDDLSYFLQSQGEQLKRMLADKRQRHYRALLTAAEEAVSRRMREKEAEVEKAAKRNAELETRAVQFSAQAQSWKAKAQAQEAQAASLQAQLKQAMVGPTNLISGDNKEESGVGEAEDAESAYVDPVSERRVTSPSSLSCKMCRTRIALVVLLPCRHLCVCRECNNVVQSCPICLSIRSASVEVYLA